ncbi:OsmC family protein [Bacteroidota bacterium]
MKSELNIKWLENMAFESEINGHKIIVDADPKFGGENKGPRPKPFVLLAMAGCTGMDVISLFKKFRLNIKDLNIRVVGDMTEEHPIQFTKMHVIYEIKGIDLDARLIEKAVRLSQEKYCGVIATYKKGIEVSYEIDIKS